MQVTVTGRHFEVTPAMRSYVESRLDRLHRYLGEVRWTHVTLTVEKHRNLAEILMDSNGHEFIIKDESETDMFTAVDSVAHRLEQQVRRAKDKRTTERKGRRGTNGAHKHGTLSVLKAESVGRGAGEHDFIHSGDYPIEKLTVEDAIQALEASDHEFKVFTDRETDFVHIVYKLPDGNYGVLNLNTTA